MKFFESISTAAHTLGLPLGEEQIEITFTRDGKRVTEIVEIGKRIGLFKKSVEKDEAKLKAYWKDWEALQGDFVELGIDVFGPEMFGQAAKDARGRGFVKEMEVTDEEHDGRMGGLAAEVEEMAEGVLARMKESEKVDEHPFLPSLAVKMLTCCRSWTPVPENNRRGFSKHSSQNDGRVAKGEFLFSGTEYYC